MKNVNITLYYVENSVVNNLAQPSLNKLEQLGDLSTVIHRKHPMGNQGKGLKIRAIPKPFHS